MQLAIDFEGVQFLDTPAAGPTLRERILAVLEWSRDVEIWEMTEAVNAHAAGPVSWFYLPPPVRSISSLDVGRELYHMAEEGLIHAETVWIGSDDPRSPDYRGFYRRWSKNRQSDAGVDAVSGVRWP